MRSRLGHGVPSLTQCQSGSTMSYTIQLQGRIGYAMLRVGSAYGTPVLSVICRARNWCILGSKVRRRHTEVELSIDRRRAIATLLIRSPATRYNSVDIVPRSGVAASVVALSLLSQLADFSLGIIHNASAITIQSHQTESEE